MTDLGVARGYYGGPSCDVLTRDYVVYVIAVFAEGSEEDSGDSRSTWPVWSSKMNPGSSLFGPKTRVYKVRLHFEPACSRSLYRWQSNSHMRCLADRQVDLRWEFPTNGSLA